MKKNKNIPIALCAAGAAVLAALSIAADRSRSEAGKSVFDARCVTCHGTDGKGAKGMAGMLGVKPEAMDLTAPQTQKQSDDKLHGIILKGKGKMPPFAGTLRLSQVQDVVSYIRRLARPAGGPSKRPG